VKYIAGPKLRAQAIARTIAHLETEERALKTRQGSEIGAIMHRMHQYTLTQYLQDERKRLMKLRGGL